MSANKVFGTALSAFKTLFSNYFISQPYAVGNIILLIL